MKNVKYALVSLLAFGTLGLSAVAYLGLDDNAADSADPALETAWPDEEIGFKEVASVIEGFVQRQFDIRKDPENFQAYEKEVSKQKPKEYSNVYNDLPGKKEYATRDVHRKTHGCFQADLEVDKNIFTEFNSATKKLQSSRKDESPDQRAVYGPLPQSIATISDLGIFQPSKKYDAIVRFSNGHPMNRHDKMPDARGFAVKIVAPKVLNRGQALSSQSVEAVNSNTALDILSINFPTFFVNEKQTALKYTKINDAFLGGAYDFGSALVGKFKEGKSIFLSGIDVMEIREALWVNGSIIQNPLSQEYFSMVPSRLGPKGSARAVKYFWSPEACEGQNARFETFKKSEWPDWSNDHSYANPTHPIRQYWTAPFRKSESYPHDYLRRNLEQTLGQQDFCFGLYFQPYRDQVSTNIEDSTDLWLRSEEQREWWKKDVIPGEYDPLWKLYSSNRDEVIRRIDQKAVVVPVRAATLRIQKRNDLAQNTKFCEDLSYNPWNGNIDYHKPLGVISRLKRRVYNASRRLRHILNHFPKFSFERKAL